MHLSTVNEWTSWIESIHKTEIELGLERVKAVGARLGVLTPAVPVIIVGGTNGKGSTVAGLEAIYLAAGYQVGAFTSPFLFKLNEEVRINGRIVTDEQLCVAFSKVAAAREETSLTPFEFYTLAALFLFQTYPLDVLILEVGLGGRLDAVNIINADVAIVTTISIDHVNYLGDTREKIAFEKAGIFRAKQPAICGDFQPPASLLQHAGKLGSPLFCQGKDFYAEEYPQDWSWFNRTETNVPTVVYEHLPKPVLLLQNMSTVLMAITLLQQRVPVTKQAVEQGLKNVSLAGRIQTFAGPITEIYDVSHNPAAIGLLAENLHRNTNSGKTIGVFSMLADKDMLESIRVIRNHIDVWCVAPLRDKRAASSDQLMLALQKNQINHVIAHDSIELVYKHALAIAKPSDRIIVFGSFHTVADVLSYNKKYR